MPIMVRILTYEGDENWLLACLPRRDVKGKLVMQRGSITEKFITDVQPIIDYVMREQTEVQQ